MPTRIDPWGMARGGDDSFYLIRHGTTALNEQDGNVDRIRGWMDVPLDAKGCIDAENLGRQLKNSRISTLVSSDLERAVDTAKAIQETTGAELIETNMLRPWNVGDYTGKPTRDCLAVLKDFCINQADQAIPGGESFNSFRDRAIRGVQFALSQRQPVAIVSHHRVERLIFALQDNGSLDQGLFIVPGELPGSFKRILKSCISCLFVSTVTHFPDDDDGKCDKSSVEYSMGHGDGDMCSRCQYYVSPGRAESKCRRVKGMVEYRYWCILYEPLETNRQWKEDGGFDAEKART